MASNQVIDGLPLVDASAVFPSSGQPPTLLVGPSESGKSFMEVDGFMSNSEECTMGLFVTPSYDKEANAYIRMNIPRVNVITFDPVSLCNIWKTISDMSDWYSRSTSNELVMNFVKNRQQMFVNQINAYNQRIITIRNIVKPEQQLVQEVENTLFSDYMLKEIAKIFPAPTPDMSNDDQNVVLASHTTAPKVKIFIDDITVQLGGIEKDKRTVEFWSFANGKWEITKGKLKEAFNQLMTDFLTRGRHIASIAISIHNFNVLGSELRYELGPIVFCRGDAVGQALAIRTFPKNHKDELTEMWKKVEKIQYCKLVYFPNSIEWNGQRTYFAAYIAKPHKGELQFGCETCKQALIAIQQTWRSWQMEQPTQNISQTNQVVNDLI